MPDRDSGARQERRAMGIDKRNLVVRKSEELRFLARDIYRSSNRALAFLERIAEFDRRHFNGCGWPKEDVRSILDQFRRHNFTPNGYQHVDEKTGSCADRGDRLVCLALKDLISESPTGNKGSIHRTTLEKIIEWRKQFDLPSVDINQI